MRDTEGMPENHVRVCNIGVGIFLDPSWKALGGFAAGLWNVAAGGVDLGIIVYRNALAKLKRSEYRELR